MPIKPEKLHTTVQIPQGVTVTVNRHMLLVDGPRGRAIKSFRKIPVHMSVGEGVVDLRAAGARKRDFAIMNTARSLVRNLCEGVVEGYTVKMKIVFAHFPITIKVQDDTVLIENFQGERAPRRARICGSTKVVLQGDDVVVSGHVLTDVTQTAANIHLHTRIKNKDHRVFLDGIYVYDKRKGI